jgi:integrase/recombinase XerD
MSSNKARINLRFKDMDGGKKSVYLDYYKDGKRIREVLRLYLLPEDNPKDVANNKKILQEAKIIQKQRLDELTAYDTDIDATDNYPHALFLVNIINEFEKETLGKGDKSTANNIRGMLHAIDGFHGLSVTLDEVNADYCDKFVDYLHNEHEGIFGKIKMTTARNYIYLFSSSLNMAVDKGYIKVNPMRLVTVHDRITKERPKKIFLTVDEIKTLMNTQCPVLARPQVKQAFMLCIFTGMMPDNVVNLKWKDIRMQNNRTTVQFKPRKETLTVPLSSVAQRWLPETTNRRGPVFNGLPCSTEITCILKKWQLKAEIKKTLSFTVAKNTFAYLLLSSGTDIATACNLMGMSKKSFKPYLEMTDYRPASTDEKLEFLQIEK